MVQSAQSVLNTKTAERIEEGIEEGMELFVNCNVQLRTIDHENADLLFPLLKEDLKEISQWFSIEEDYKLEYEHEYVEEKDPPYDETFVIY